MGWLWVVLSIIGFSCCGCGGLGAIFLANANKWESYTPDNGAFTAEFPGKPVYQTKPFKWKDGKEGTGHEFAALQLLNAQGFVVYYTDLPKSLKGALSDDAILKFGLEDIKAKYTNFTVQSTTELPVGKHKAMDVDGTYTDPQHGKLQVSVRSIIVGDRLFMLFAVGQDRKKLTPHKNRFFNSFKPADPKDKEKDKPADPKE